MKFFYWPMAFEQNPWMSLAGPLGLTTGIHYFLYIQVFVVSCDCVCSLLPVIVGIHCHL